MPDLQRPRFIQLTSIGLNDYGWHLWALDEAGDVWWYDDNKGWKRETMKRLDDDPPTA